jgi:ArsR family transcriptional regulator
MIEQKENLNQNMNLSLVHWLKILGEPKRLLLLNQIFEGICCNCELGKSLSLSPNLVSHHLSVLNEAGIINSTRDKDDARWIHYSINVEGLKEVKILFDDFFNLNRIQPNKSVCGPKKQ